MNELARVIALEVTRAQRVAATHRSVRFDKKAAAHQFGNDIQRTREGYIGEQVAADWLGVELLDEFDYDFIYKEQRFDVKTITAAGPPPWHFLATVNSCKPGRQHRQATDFYLFMRLRYDSRLAWVVGFKSSRLFWEQGRFVPKGEPLFPGQLAEKADATVIEIRRLNAPERLL